MPLKALATRFTVLLACLTVSPWRLYSYNPTMAAIVRKSSAKAGDSLASREHKYNVIPHLRTRRRGRAASR